MAEPVGMASGVLAIAVFALQSSKTLYELFDSFQKHGRTIQQLKNEVEALTAVLEILQETLNQHPELSSLELPLLHCGKACQEFAKVIQKCTKHTKGSQTSVRDWLRFSYMGKNISGFTNLIAGYKATVTIALADANIRTSKVTAKLLEEYKALISSTTYDLEEVLQDTETRMRDPMYEDPANLSRSIDRKADVDEERASIEQCLKICIEVSTHVDQAQSKLFQGGKAARLPEGDTSAPDKPRIARLITTEALIDCKQGMSSTTAQLRTRLQDADRRLVNALDVKEDADDPESTNQRMREALDSVKQCLSICDDAADKATPERVNVFEDVEMADDGNQLIVSTIGDLISARRITAGSRSNQYLGQMSDETVQHLARSHPQRNFEQNNKPFVERGTHFENRHGTGQKLS